MPARSVGLYVIPLTGVEPPNRPAALLRSHGDNARASGIIDSCQVTCSTFP